MGHTWVIYGSYGAMAIAFGLTCRDGQPSEREISSISGLNPIGSFANTREGGEDADSAAEAESRGEWHL